MSEPLRFIHCADIHLDCPLGGVSELPDELAAIAKNATFLAFDNLIGEAISRKVDFVVVAGDIYNSRDKSLRAQLAFRDGMKRLADAGIDAFIVHGNHDPLDGWTAKLTLPSSIYCFPGDTVHVKSYVKNGRVAARIYGISYPRRDVQENLAVQFKCDNDDCPAIAVLHCMVGSLTGHETYAPTTKEELLASGFDYWALGHVHTRVELHDGHPAIVYPGNIQGLHRNEAGERGCYMVEIDEARDCRLTFLPLDCLRFESLTIDISNTSTINEAEDIILESCREGVSPVDSIVTVELIGRTGLNRELRREAYASELLGQLRENLEADEPHVWIDSLRIRTRSFHDVASLTGRQDFISDVLSFYESLQHPESDGRRELLESLGELLSGWTGARYIQPMTDADLADLIDEARDRTLDDLLGDTGDAY